MKYGRLVGEGGFSGVYHVTDGETGKPLACKIVCRKDLAERERKFLSLASHPLFPQYEGFFASGQAYCIVMEYLPGSSLRELVERRGHLSVRRTAEIAGKLGEGLLFLHELSEPVLYRDLKPENVMIRQDGRVRLMDLGCACFLREADATRAGTRGYAAPEQLAEERGIRGKAWGAETAGAQAAGVEHAGVSSDVYALGKLMLYMLTGSAKGAAAGGKGRGIAWKKTRRREQRARAQLMVLIRDMTQERQCCRVPDMRVFLHRLSPYLERKRSVFFGCWNREKGHRKELSFFYEQDVRRGL